METIFSDKCIDLRKAELKYALYISYFVGIIATIGLFASSMAVSNFCG